MSDRFPLLAYGYLVLAIAMAFWDVLLAGRIANLRRTPRVFQAATAIGGLLLVPALFVSFAASSILYGRAIQPVSWIWPFTAVLFVLQAIYALTRRMVTPAFGIPILAYNVIIAIVAVSRFSVAQGTVPPEAGLALSAAQVSMLGIFFGPSALWSAAHPVVPLFSPSLPSRWRSSAAARGILALAATIITALTLVEIPNSIETIRSYKRYSGEQLQEHPEGDFDIGIKIFPDLRSAPPPLALKHDLALADTLNVPVISIVINPEAARGIALDSIARSIDDIRTDSTRLIIALGYPQNARIEFAKSESEYTKARLDDVNRIARRLRPDILLPAHEPYVAGSQALGTLEPRYWIDYLTRAAGIAHYVNRRIRVGVGASSYGARDSVLYTWAALRASPVDVVGFTLLPGFDGATSLDTHLRVAQRWMRQSPTKPKDHWVFAAGGYPIAHGERNQELAVWGVLAWATAQAAIKGLVVADAGDYDSLKGLRAPGGRLRSSVAAIVRAERGLKATAQ